MEEYLARNTQVTTLVFERCFLGWSQWCAMAQSAPNIQELTMDEIESSTEVTTDHVPGTFHRLTACELTKCRDIELCFKLLRGAPLKRLKLHYNWKCYDEANLIIDNICRFTNITSLHLSQHDHHCKNFTMNDEDLMRLVRSLSRLQELYVEEGRFSLGCVEQILKTSNAIGKFDVGLRRNRNAKLEPAILNGISAIIDGRPNLHVKVRVPRECVRVS